MAVIPAGILAAQGITGALGAAQTIAGSRKSKFDLQNEERLNRLLGLEQGGRLGLTGVERRTTEQSLLSPVRSAAAETRRRAESAMGVMGGSGADLARLREEQTRAIGEAGERAALAIAQADARKEAAQRQEIAQREALAETRRQERQASLFGGLAQAAGAAGRLSGGVPEVMRAAGLAGAPIADTAELRTRLANLGVEGSAAEMILRMNPRALTRAVNDAEQYLATGERQYLTDESIDLIIAADEAKRQADILEP